MDAANREFVRQRAGDRCEYCRLRQADEPFARYQLEHVVPVQHGGIDDLGNLALACPYCNRHKGPNLAGLDPLDGRLVPLFHPRRDRWDDHFADRGPIVVGLSAVGRATVRVLAMNDRLQAELRTLVRPAGD